MFGFIKKLFSGILAFFSGLFGGKKSQDAPELASQAKQVAKKAKGFFMELDETGDVKSDVAKPSEAKKAPEKPEPAKAAVAIAKPSKAEQPKPAEVPAAAENGKIRIEAQPNPPASANNGNVDPNSPTFAPNYLTPMASNSRRRPGPSLDLFRDMARQVKSPST